MSSGRPTLLRLGIGLLWVVSVVGVYLLLWRDVTNWSGKWPAPYWFAVGLGVLLAYGLVMPRLKHLFWVIPFACVLVCVTWFFEFGIYEFGVNSWIYRSHLSHYLGYCSEELPTATLMAGFVILLVLVRGAERGWRLAVSICLFLEIFFGMFTLAGGICSSRLPSDGTFGFGFDHDVFGFRLGSYYLITVAVSVLLLKLCAKVKTAAADNSIGLTTSFRT
jgi:hypothetical protein